VRSIREVSLLPWPHQTFCTYSVPARGPFYQPLVVAELGFRYDHLSHLHAAQIFQLRGKTKMEGRHTLLFNPIFHFHDTLTQATKKGSQPELGLAMASTALIRRGCNNKHPRSRKPCRGVCVNRLWHNCGRDRIGLGDVFKACFNWVMDVEACHVRSCGVEWD